MNKHLDDYLCKKYPKIFAERNLPMTETCMCWGFPGDGWFFLIDNLCQHIQAHIYTRVYDPDGIFSKINWKFRDWAYKLHVPYKIVWMLPQPKYAWRPRKIPQVVAHQVKEKLGTLCFYYSGGDEYISNIVSYTEYLSSKICEDCGAMNECVGSTTKGWIHTTCARCQPKDVDGERERDWRVSDPERLELWQKMYLEEKKKDVT